jgi:excisionase family DNA binding protein
LSELSGQRLVVALHHGQTPSDVLEANAAAEPDQPGEDAPPTKRAATCLLKPIQRARSVPHLPTRKRHGGGSMSARMAPAVISTGNSGLDALADAIAERVLARLHQSEQPRLLSVIEAAAYIGRTPKALRHMIADGSVPAVRGGSRVHLDRADLDGWIEMRKCRT